MKLLIEQDENTPGVSVTTDEEDMRVADAIFMVRLAEIDHVKVVRFHTRVPVVEPDRQIEAPTADSEEPVTVTLPPL